MDDRVPLLEVREISKHYGAVRALERVSLLVYPGEVTCLLGDNGAGKSTLVKVMSGALQPDSGQLRLEGIPIRLRSPAAASFQGIATVFQELSIVQAMSVYRNFFLKREPTKGWGPFRRFDIARAQRIAREELGRIGISKVDVRRPVATLSGGERQCVAIARALYFGARILILDEPTAALGVKESRLVLRYTEEAKRRGVGIVLISHNAHHAHAVGDWFTVIRHGAVWRRFSKSQLSVDELAQLMTGDEEPFDDHSPASETSTSVANGS